MNTKMNFNFNYNKNKSDGGRASTHRVTNGCDAHHTEKKAAVTGSYSPFRNPFARSNWENNRSSL